MLEHVAQASWPHFWTRASLHFWLIFFLYISHLLPSFFLFHHC